MYKWGREEKRESLSWLTNEIQQTTWEWFVFLTYMY